MKNVAESFTLVKLLAKRLNATRWNPDFFFSFSCSIDDTSDQVVSFVCESERRGEEKKAWYPFYFDTVIVIVVRSLYHTFEAKRYLSSR